MNLYELSEEIKIAEQAIEDYAESNEGDITNCPMNGILDRLEVDRDEKALNCGIWYKNIISQSKAIALEMKSLAARKKTLDNKAERIKDYVQDLLPKGLKLENSKCKLGWRKSQTVSIPSELKPEFVKGTMKIKIIKVEEKFDKTACKQYIKDFGKLVVESGEGEDKFGYHIRLLDKQNVQIK